MLVRHTQPKSLALPTDANIKLCIVLLFIASDWSLAVLASMHITLCLCLEKLLITMGYESGQNADMFSLLFLQLISPKDYLSPWKKNKQNKTVGLLLY